MKGGDATRCSSGRISCHVHTRKRSCVYVVATIVSEKEPRVSVTTGLFYCCIWGCLFGLHHKTGTPPVWAAAADSLQQEKLSDLKLRWDLFADVKAQTKSGSLNSDSVWLSTLAGAGSVQPFSPHCLCLQWFASRATVDYSPFEGRRFYDLLLWFTMAGALLLTG